MFFKELEDYVCEYFRLEIKLVYNIIFISIVLKIRTARLPRHEVDLTTLTSLGEFFEVSAAGPHM